MVQQKNVRKDSRLQRQIEELQKRMDAMEDRTSLTMPRKYYQWKRQPASWT